MDKHLAEIDHTDHTCEFVTCYRLTAEGWVKVPGKELCNGCGRHRAVEKKSDATDSAPTADDPDCDHDFLLGLCTTCGADDGTWE